MRIDLDEGSPAPTTVSVGEPIEIDVVTPGATGYEWRVDLDEGRWERAGTDLVPSFESFGASGLTTFELIPQAAGRQELVFRLIAPWDAEPAREIRLVVDVTPSGTPPETP